MHYNQLMNVQIQKILANTSKKYFSQKNLIKKSLADVGRKNLANVNQKIPRQCWPKNSFERC